jgi:tetratricopeptide (TPR) repeat protein
VRKIEEQLVLEEARQVKERFGRADREIPEEARRLLERAAEVGEQAERRNWAEKVEVAIREHLEESRRLKELGKLDAAEEHFRQAERLKRELGEAMPREEEFRPPEPPFVGEGLRAPVLREPLFRPEMPGPQNVLVEIRELRRDINGLREELSEIKRLLRELVER